MLCGGCYLSRRLMSQKRKRKRSRQRKRSPNRHKDFWLMKTVRILVILICLGLIAVMGFVMIFLTTSGQEPNLTGTVIEQSNHSVYPSTSTTGTSHASTPRAPTSHFPSITYLT